MDTATARSYDSFQAAAKKAKHLMADLQELYPGIQVNSKIIARAFLDHVIDTDERGLLNRMIPDALGKIERRV